MEKVFKNKNNTLQIILNTFNFLNFIFKTNKETESLSKKELIILALSFLIFIKDRKSNQKTIQTIPKRILNIY